jgi:hypothetical protein
VGDNRIEEILVSNSSLVSGLSGELVRSGFARPSVLYVLVFVYVYVHACARVCVRVRACVRVCALARARDLKIRGWRISLTFSNFPYRSHTVSKMTFVWI